MDEQEFDAWAGSRHIRKFPRVSVWTIFATCNASLKHSWLLSNENLPGFNGVRFDSRWTRKFTSARKPSRTRKLVAK